MGDQRAEPPRSRSRPRPTPSRPSSGSSRAPHRDRSRPRRRTWVRGSTASGSRSTCATRSRSTPSAEPGVTLGGRGRGRAPDRRHRPREPGHRRDRRRAANAHRRRAAIHGRNRIPLERGLGSSAAAAVAGVALADAVLGLGLDRTAILEVAAGLEGHPDNAAAAVFGGFTIVVDEGVVARFDPDPELRPALFVPSDLAISTDAARRVAPGRGPSRGRRRQRGTRGARGDRPPARTRPAPRGDARPRSTRTSGSGSSRRCARSSTACAAPGSRCASRARDRRCSRSSGTTSSRRSPATGGGSCACRCARPGSRSAKAEGAYHLRRWWSDDRTRSPARPGPDSRRPTRRRTPRSASSHPPRASEQGATPVLVTDLASKTLAVKEGETFLYSDLEGNLDHGGHDGLGLYSHDTRFLSHFRMT